MMPLETFKKIEYESKTDTAYLTVERLGDGEEVQLVIPFTTYGELPDWITVEWVELPNDSVLSLVTNRRTI